MIQILFNNDTTLTMDALQDAESGTYLNNVTGTMFAQVYQIDYVTAIGSPPLTLVYTPNTNGDYTALLPQSVTRTLAPNGRYLVRFWGTAEGFNFDRWADAACVRNNTGC